MAIESVFCHVRQAPVRVVTDLEGAITRLACEHYDESSGECQLRLESRRGGPLSQLVARLDAGTLDRPAVRCVLVSS